MSSFINSRLENNDCNILIASTQYTSITDTKKKVLERVSSEEDDEIEKEEYKTHYPYLLKSFKYIRRKHIQQLLQISKNNYKTKNGLLSIKPCLNKFALNIFKRKTKYHNKSFTDKKDFDFSYTPFMAKLYKNHYISLLESFFILHKDYSLLHSMIQSRDSAINTLNFLILENLQAKLQQVNATTHPFNLDKLLKLYKYGITTSSKYLTDIGFQSNKIKCSLNQELGNKKEVVNNLEVVQDESSRLCTKVEKLRNLLPLNTPSISKFVHNKLEPADAGNSGDNVANVEAKKCDLKKKLIYLKCVIREEETKRKELHNKLQELMGNVRVYCRIRPYARSVLEVHSSTTVSIPNYMKLAKFPCEGNSKTFTFNKVFGPKASQSEVFESIKQLVTSCVDGFNVCIMAYGQTGSGKTHTMMGNSLDPGVNKRAIKELLKVCNHRKLWNYELCLSMVEIYNDEVRDLLTLDIGEGYRHNQLRQVKLMTNETDDIIMCGLSQHVVENEENIMTYLRLGEKNRKVGSTMLNIHSSRSHLILLLKVTGTNFVHKTTTEGMLTLCDLAGSENIFKSGATGQSFVEATSINKSLSLLGRVFDALRNQEKPPYRETKLTFLLKPTLGGDAKCLLLVNTRGDCENLSESVRALQFGQNAMQVAPEKIRLKREKLLKI